MAAKKKSTKARAAPRRKGPKQKPPSKKAASKGGGVTTAERRARMDLTEELMLQSARRAEIHDALLAKYGVKSTGADELIRKVNARWADEAARSGTLQQKRDAAIRRAERDARAARAIASTCMFPQQQIAALNAADKAEMRRARLEGTLAPAKVEALTLGVHDFNRSGRRRVAGGEDPFIVLKTGGAANDPEPEHGA